jgi:uncharacterized protein YcbK (DUF882 family)
MGDLSTHFDRKEFACKCGCGFDTVDTHLIEMLEAARQHFGYPALINCGCRCASRNSLVGGAANSQHMLGKAADIRVKGYTPAEVAGWFEKTYPDSRGIGRYNSFTHVDSRAARARWNYTTGAA